MSPFTKKTLAKQTQEEFISLRQQYNQIVNSDVREKLSRYKQSIYEYGNKPGVPLARAPKGSQTKSHITQITPNSGIKLSDSVAIAQKFKKFYWRLYNLQNIQTQQCSTWADLISSFLTASGMPLLPLEVIAGMEAPITNKELALVIESSKPRKAPGPDGLKLICTIKLSRTFSLLTSYVLTSPSQLMVS